MDPQRPPSNWAENDDGDDNDVVMDENEGNINDKEEDYGSQDNGDNEEEVQVWELAESNRGETAPSDRTKEQQQRQRRRFQNNRRKKDLIQRLIRRSHGYPSFVSLLRVADQSEREAAAHYAKEGEGDAEDDDDDDDGEEEDDRDYDNFNTRTIRDKRDDDVFLQNSHAMLSLEETLERRQRLRQTIRINIDERLGLIPPQSTPQQTQSHQPTLQLSQRTPAGSSAAVPPVVSAADEGYYEGIISPMSILPEDQWHLSELHQWIRRNLQLFSATERDVLFSQAGRRTPTVQGKVGIRCIHCAKALSQDDKDEYDNSNAPSKASWPPGAVSYPTNVAAIYTACTMKPQLHFETTCPYLPMGEKAHLLRLMQAAPAVKRRRQQQQQPDATTAAFSSATQSIPASLYYTLSAKRLGLVDVADGIRFGRDLNLEPLPLETVRKRMELENDHEQQQMQQLTAMQSVPKLPPAAAVATPFVAVGVAHESSVLASPVHPPSQMELQSSLPIDPSTARTADEESERVLAEAVMEKDDPEKNLSRSQDKAKVTDYFFLTIRQMAVCHAVPVDFATKGKKTKLMRVGFAGFCCRHCMQADGLPSPSDFSCRSFSSAADNLSSSIANSFANHLQRCPSVPARLKKALSTYKRLHQRQLALLPYGSQRRLIHTLWARMRALDIPKEEMMKRIKDNPRALAPAPMVVASSSSPSAETHDLTAEPNSTRVAGESEGSVTRAEGAPVNSEASHFEPKKNVIASATTPDDFAPPERPIGFPQSDDPETLAELEEAEATWDPARNDNLILPSERYLVSDYVFLTMLQLKVAIPGASDAVRGRRVGSSSGMFMAGLCCIHCAEQPQVIIPSGRSFPSAPDNFASSLNSSLYAHMQACTYLPARTKVALANTRKLHSVQCSSLKFGSQRRFFNILYNRLKSLPLPDPGEIQSPIQEKKVKAMRVGDESATESLLRAGFMQVSCVGPDPSSSSMFLCIKCRMVPLQFRTSGSVISISCTGGTNSTVVESAKTHSDECMESGLNLNPVMAALNLAIKQDLAEGTTPQAVLGSNSYQALVHACVAGSKQLERVFVEGLMRLLRNKTTKSDSGDDTAGLWSAFPSTVDTSIVQSALEAFLFEHGGNASESSQLCKLNPHMAQFLLLIAPGLNAEDLGAVDNKRIGKDDNDETTQGSDIKPESSGSLGERKWAGNNSHGAMRIDEDLDQPDSDHHDVYEPGERKSPRVKRADFEQGERKSQRVRRAAVDRLVYDVDDDDDDDDEDNDDGNLDNDEIQLAGKAKMESHTTGGDRDNDDSGSGESAHDYDENGDDDDDAADADYGDDGEIGHDYD